MGQENHRYDCTGLKAIRQHLGHLARAPCGQVFRRLHRRGAGPAPRELLLLKLVARLGLKRERVERLLQIERAVALAAQDKKMEATAS